MTHTTPLSTTRPAPLTQRPDLPQLEQRLTHVRERLHQLRRGGNLQAKDQQTFLEFYELIEQIRP